MANFGCPLNAGYAISVYVLHQRVSDDIVNKLKAVSNVCNVKF